MSPRLGLPAVCAACALLFTAPAFAADVDPTTTTTTTPTITTPTTTAPSSTTTTATTTTMPPTAELSPSGLPGPATAGQPPSRGTQVQLRPPPPPPPTLPWFFQLPPNSGSGRRIVYSKWQQTVWVFDENDTLIKMHRVSGKQTPHDPTPGVYRVYSRSIRTYSISNPSITWGYMIRFAKGANGGNIGFHEIPFQYGRPVQSEAQLGQPLSGGCVRQAVSDAVWMWNWAGIGTVVVVTP